MAVGDAAAFFPIRPPGPGDAFIQVGETAWAAVIDFPLVPAAGMSAGAATSLLSAFSRFLVGAFSTLPQAVAPKLVVIQQRLQLGSVAARYHQAATDLAGTSPGASDVAWQWAAYVRSLQGVTLAARRGAIVLTASQAPPGLRDRAVGVFRGRERKALGADEAAGLLREAVRQVTDAGKDAGFGLTLLTGEELANFASTWTRGEALGVRVEEAVSVV